MDVNFTLTSVNVRGIRDATKRARVFEWCKENKLFRSSLAATLKADRTKPSTKHNPWQAKGLYARYSNV